MRNHSFVAAQLKTTGTNQPQMETPSDSTSTHKAIIEAIDAKILNIDAAIKRHGKLLDLIQPFAPGKISVRYIKLRGGAAKTPNFVAWKWTPKGREIGKIIHYELLKAETVRRCVKSYGPFAGTEDDVRLLLQQIRRLMERRKALTSILGRLAQAAGTALRIANDALVDTEEWVGTEMLPLHQRYQERMKIWKARQAAKAAERAERESHHAIPDPADYDWDETPPPDIEESDRHAIPESYVDESGEYVGP